MPQLFATLINEMRPPPLILFISAEATGRLEIANRISHYGCRAVKGQILKPNLQPFMDQIKGLLYGFSYKTMTVLSWLAQTDKNPGHR